MASISEIPVYKIFGTHYEVGKAVGQLQKEYISGRIINVNGSFKNKVLPFYESSKGRPICEELFANSKSSFPEYMDEIKGIADGVGVDQMTIFLLNAEGEIAALRKHSTGEGCTTLFIHSDNQKLLVHNEDVIPNKTGRDWIFQVKITPDTALWQEEAYLAYTQAGWLAGRCFGFNKHGLALTSNIIYPRTINVKGIPRPFVDRAILSSSNIDNAIKKACVGNGLASCDSVNVAQNIDGIVTMANLELYGGPDGTVYDKKLCYPGNVMVHANEYERLSFEIVPDTSSKNRLARVEEIFKNIGTPKSKMDALSIIGDVQNNKFPIYRCGAPPDTLATAFTSCFDMELSSLDIIKGNPKDPERTLTIPFSSLN